MPIILDGTAGIDNDATDLSYTGTLTGGTGVVNLGSGQVYKDASGNVGIGTSSPTEKLQLQNGNFHITDGTQTLRQGVTTGLGFVGMQTNHPLVLFTNDTERMRIDGSGYVTMSAQPGFLAYGSKSKTAATWQIVSDAFSTVSYNVGSHYNTSNGRFTAPVAGRYCFYAGGYSPNAGNGARYAWCATVNNGSQQFIAGGDYSTVDSPLAGYSAAYQLNAGDYVDLRMYSEIAATIGNATHASFFGGYLLG